MKVLGVDLGDRRIGLAVCDPEGKVAVGAGTVVVRSEREALAALAALAREREVEEVVIGLPLTMRGTRGPRAEVTERFAARLREVLPMPVSLWDERLTTAEASRALRSARTALVRASGRTDEAAATIILQSWLDARRARAEDERAGGGATP